MTLPTANPGNSAIKIQHLLLRGLSHNYFPIFILLLINLIIGWLVFPAYGESWDEQLRYQYGERSLKAYLGEGRSLIDEKGAFYVMIARLGSEVIRWLNPTLQSIQAWHFIHFLSFLLGIFFLYKICLKFVGKWPALGTVLLFNTQPLLWGHAFINPKDIPFMAFFLGSVALGLEMADFYATRQAKPIENGPEKFGDQLPVSIQKDREQSRNRTRLLFLILAGISIGLLFILFFSTGWLKGIAARQIELAASPDGRGALSQLFNRFAENRTSLPVDLYIQKSNLLMDRILCISGLVLAALACLCLVGGYPATTRQIWSSLAKPFIIQAVRSFKEPKVWLAGIFFGLSTSIRVLGPASAILVGLYFILKARWKALPVLLAYSAIGMLFIYATWPYLWNAPLSNFIHSLGAASDYPWEGKVRFAGVDYPVAQAPRSFLPVLMTIQTPEVVLALFILGSLIGLIAAHMKKLNGALILVAGLWFWFPLISAIVLQPTMYDNYRQFLFIIPAAYLFIACALWFVLGVIKKPGWKLVTIFLLVLPNVIALVQLHPYQYIYYNSLVGGAAGAARNYESDYWATSYRAAAEFLNQDAPPGAAVLVLGPSQLVSHYARPDLNVAEFSPQKTSLPQKPFYVVLFTRYDKDRTLFPGAPVVFEVERGGAALAVVKWVDQR